MNQTLICTIPANINTYEIVIQHAGLSQQLAYFKSLHAKCAIITDDNLVLLYGEPLCQALKESEVEAHLFSFPAGEASKTRATKEQLEDQLFAKGLGRDTCILALGGGVVTDITGYLAATYCRGVPLVMLPTSLLAMVDASLGGKTGVNVTAGKNLLGCIYQPQRVIIDTSTLQSLPKKELTNGIVEMLKHGIITNTSYFEFLEQHAHELLALDPHTLKTAIFESCRIKNEIVEQDEKEQGKRHLLNFGHTVGHTLETLTHYSLSHGEAVAIGMLVESKLAVLLGHLTQDSFERIYQVLMAYHLPLQLPCQFSIHTLLEAMSMDKKSLKGRPRFVIINGIGSALPCESLYCMHVEEAVLKTALDWMNNALCCH